MTRQMTLATCFSLVVGTVASADGPPRLFPGKQYLESASTYCVRVGDLNGDDILDVTASTAADVYVLIGLGGEQFEEGAFIEDVGGDTHQHLLADFDGDGELDIALDVTFDVVVMLGYGDGTFAPPQLSGAGGDIELLAAGDFDGDGMLDLAAGGDDSLSVLLGQGDGTFQAPLRLGGGARWIATADLNADGFDDLAATRAGVEIRLSAGDGTFLPAENYPGGPDPRALALGDADNDGDVDVVSLAVTNEFRVVLNNGDGTFEPAFLYDLPPAHAEMVDLVDFDADGNLDVVTNGIAVNRGLGDGTFTDPVDLGFRSDFARWFVSADIDADDDIDFVSRRSVVGVGGPVWVTYNDRGALRLPITSFPGNVVSHVIGDFNGDGIEDVAVCSQADSVTILAGDGEGRFEQTGSYEVGDTPVDMVVGDFNGDHAQDLAVVNMDSHDVAVLIGRGDGTFNEAIFNTIGSMPSDIGVADVNEDGEQDIVVTLPQSQFANLRVMFGNGDGTFEPQGFQDVGVSDAVALLVGDFDGDGSADLCITDNPDDPSLAVVLGDGQGGFSDPVSVNQGMGEAVAADLDDDGALDLVGGDTVLWGRGDGTFDPIDPLPAGGPRHPVVADLNRDGHLDIASGLVEDSIDVVLGLGRRDFEMHDRFFAPTARLLAADVDHDGHTDLVALEDELTVLLNTSPACADLNCDGVEDVLDFVAFQQAWVADDLIADCNGDGIFDVTDFVCFQSVFLNGCP